MAKHAKFSPSGSSRWIPCPGSLRLSEGIAETTSPYAHEGTVCHDVASKCLQQKINPADFLGEVVDEVLMTKELIDGIQMYVDEIRGLTKELRASGGKIEFQVELTPDCWGTLDAMLWNPELLYVGDLKMGKGVIVQVEDNPQLMIYAVGAMKYLQQEHGLKPKEVIMSIIQPRTVNPIRVWKIEREKLVDWYKNKLLPALKEGENGDAPCVPGEVQCRWCKASAVCTAQAEHMLRSAERAFAPFTKQETPKIDTSGKLTIEVMATLLPVFKHLKDWMGSIEAYCLAKALDGVNVPGYKVVEGRSNRKWKLNDAEVIKFVTSIGFDPMGEPKLMSPTQMEKLIGKKEAEGLGLQNYVHKPPGKETLVIESDKRPAVDLSVEDEFAKHMPDPVVVAKVEKAEPTPIADVEKLVIDSTMVITDEDTEPVAGTSAMALLMQADDIEDDEDTFEPLPVEPADDTAEGMEEAFAGTEMGDMLDGFDAEDRHENETATSGSPAVTIRAEGSGVAQPPKSAAQRLNVLNMGLGGTSLKEVAAALSMSVNQVKMQLRYLNERDGFGYEVYEDGSFTVFE